jgi:Peptidase family M23/S-layer homology domain
MHLRHRARLLLAVLALLLLPVAPAQAAGGYQQVVDLTFPVGGSTSYVDSFDAPRSGGRLHMATDIMAPEGRKIFAAVGGTVEWITGLTEAVPSYGYMIRIAGDDGRDYAYIHMGRNNGPASKAYAPGIAMGTRVERGQHIAYVGCSGNASCDAPHLHFEIHDESVDDPYEAHRINPYRSLLAAQQRGDVGGAAGVPDEEVFPFRDIARNTHQEAIVGLAEAGIMEGCDDGQFCPNAAIDRILMAEVLDRALEVPATDTDFFSDDDGLDAEPAINALAAAGVIKGCGDGTVYCPQDRVSRAQMASYLARGFDLDAVQSDFFSDDDGHAHEDNINRLAASGITLGCDVDRFCVTGDVTRGQLASFVSRGLAR